MAAIINLVLGALPLSIPNWIRGMEVSYQYNHSEVFIKCLALVMGVAQFTFVYKMEGSPGFIFAGLRVKSKSGSRITLRTAFYRALPYIVWLLAAVAIPQNIGTGIFAGYMGLVIALVGVLILSSGLVAFATCGDSIIDKLTGTQSIKSYEIG